MTLKTRMNQRKGAVFALFAILLPVLVILCSFAINVAYMQLVSTELKIATDVAAHAGGRAMSIHQNSDTAWDFAIEAGTLNTVGGQPLQIPRDEEHLRFGSSVRGNNGFGRYDFQPVTKASVDNGTGRATSIAVTGELSLPLIFAAMPGTSSVPASRRSVATQVDRDIALVLDRSGSMLFFKDDDALTEAIWDIYNTTQTHRVWRWSSWRGWYQHTYTTRLISSSERDAALNSFYQRRYSSNLRDHLGDWDIEMGEYADDWMSKMSYSSSQSTGAPRHSRWSLMAEGVDRFFDVLEVTDQEELVSLTTFSSEASADTQLQSVYDGLRAKVYDISPFGGTAIGEGMRIGLPPIINGTRARIFAAKTIVVLTDGSNNPGTADPVTVVQNIRSNNNVTIHTVTFTPGADQDAMKDVARFGGGRHYHADDGDVLVEIFEEIANNLPTILTE